ncbi:hypothetical protein [Haloferula sp.]|uniref:hypothetical protein n=1 Tax=Haloferula sp. TaxID=2497595 RepID=UPI003C76AEAF
MKPSVEQIGSLLSLKRHERPPEGYMDDFLREFHMRQREEAVKERGFAAVWSRLTGWISEPGMSKWVYGGVVGYAAVMIAVMTGERPIEVEGLSTQPASNAVVIPVQQLEELDLRPNSEGSTGEQEF